MSISSVVEQFQIHTMFIHKLERFAQEFLIASRLNQLKFEGIGKFTLKSPRDADH